MVSYSPSPDAPVKKSRKTLVIVLIIIGVLLLFSCCCCSAVFLPTLEDPVNPPLSNSEARDMTSESAEKLNSQSGLGGPSEESAILESAPKPEPEPEPEPEEVEIVYSIGDEVPVGSSAVVVTEVSEQVEYVSDNMFIDSVTTTGKFIEVHVSITNNDTSPRYFTAGDFSLIDEQGRKFTNLSSLDLDAILGGRIWLEKVNPGMGINGILVFEVPVDVNVYGLIYRDGLFDSEIIILT